MGLWLVARQPDLHARPGEGGAGALPAHAVDGHQALEAYPHAAKEAARLAARSATEDPPSGGNERCGDGLPELNRNRPPVYLDSEKWGLLARQADLSLSVEIGDERLEIDC
jgi:hypothetical protein